MKKEHSHIQSVTPKWALMLLNQLFEIEKKLSGPEGSDPRNCLRNVDKIKEAIEKEGLFYEDPTGQPFTETRTDIEATISGTDTENLKVVEVFKPIIRGGCRGQSWVIQKGIVIVESTKSKGES